MISYRRVTEKDFRRIKPVILRIIKNHGDNHITRQALRNLQTMRATDLREEGNVIWTAWDGNKLVGFVFCENYGNRTSFSVVRRSYRSQGIGKNLLLRAVSTMGRFYAEVAADNMASLRVMFAMGMVAYDAFWRKKKIILRMRNGFPVLEKTSLG